MKTFQILTTDAQCTTIKSECETPTDVLAWVIDQPSVNGRSPAFFVLEDINGESVLLNASCISQIRELSG